MASTATHEALVTDLVAAVEHRLLDPLEIVLGSAEKLEPARIQLGRDAQMWAAQLLGSDDAVASATANRLLAALFSGDRGFDPPTQWWGTPFGRIVAHRVGHPGTRRVTPVAAAAMLGVTRQAVHDLVRRGKLARDHDGRIDTTDIGRRIGARE